MSGTPSTTRLWFEYILFTLAGFVSIGIPLIPMGLAANSIAFPDIMFALMAAWVIRRPSSAPFVIVVVLGVLADALMQRPMGLWAFVLFVGMEVLRLSERAFRDIPFLLEWFYVGVLFALMLVVQNTILFVSFESMYGLSDVVWHWIRTAASYPAVVIILHWGLRIRAQKKDSRPNRLGYVL